VFFVLGGLRTKCLLYYTFLILDEVALCTSSSAIFSRRPFLSQAKYEPTVSIGMGNPVVAGALAYLGIQRESRTIEIRNVDLDLLDRRVPWLVGFLG